MVTDRQAGWDVSDDGWPCQRHASAPVGAPFPPSATAWCLFPWTTPRMTTVTAVQGRLVGSVLTFDTLLKRILSMHRVLLLGRQPAGSSGGGKDPRLGPSSSTALTVLHQDPAPPIQASDTVREVGSHCSRGDPVNHCAVPQITLGPIPGYREPLRQWAVLCRMHAARVTNHNVAPSINTSPEVAFTRSHILCLQLGLRLSWITKIFASTRSQVPGQTQPA